MSRLINEVVNFAVAVELGIMLGVIILLIGGYIR
jgi:hypothetical protein